MLRPDSAWKSSANAGIQRTVCQVFVKLCLHSNDDAEDVPSGFGPITRWTDSTGATGDLTRLCQIGLTGESDAFCLLRNTLYVDLD